MHKDVDFDKKMVFDFYRKFFFILILFIVMDSVSGLGVSPGSFNINFVPNLTTSFNMSVVNYPPKDQDVEIYVGLTQINESVVDEFRDIVSLEKRSLSFNKNENIKKVRVDLRFPEGFSRAGLYVINIGAMPAISGGEGLNIRAGNEISIFVNVSDVYVSPRFAKVRKLKVLNIDAKSVKKGERANITILVKSESDVVLKNVSAKIKLIQNGREIGVIRSNQVELNPGEEKNLSISFNSSIVSSSFLVLDVEIFYDSNSIKMQSALNVFQENQGSLNVEKVKFGFLWWILIVIVVFIIILILFFLWKRRKNRKEEEEQVRVEQEIFFDKQNFNKPNSNNINKI